MRKLGQFIFETNCVSCPGRDAGEAINDMKAASREVTYATMRRRVTGLLETAGELGYDRSFPLRTDWHVSYHRSVFRGRRCYYFVWSAIEYIFVEA